MHNKFACNFIHLDGKKKLSYTLIQYLFEEEEHKVVVTKHHGNTNARQANSRIRYAFLSAVQDFLDKVYCSSGDVTNVRNMNELPRGPLDLYNARHAAKKVTLSDPHLLSDQGSASQNSSDAMWMLLQKVKRDESIARLPCSSCIRPSVGRISPILH